MPGGLSLLSTGPTVSYQASIIVWQHLHSCSSAVACLPAEESLRPAGLGGLLTAARRIGSREQLARSLQDASCFFLVPEGLSRELRGRGLAAWAHENVLQPLAELQAPQGTVRVSGEVAAAATLHAVGC